MVTFLMNLTIKHTLLNLKISQAKTAEVIKNLCYVRLFYRLAIKPAQFMKDGRKGMMKEF